MMITGEDTPLIRPSSKCLKNEVKMVIEEMKSKKPRNPFSIDYILNLKVDKEDRNIPLSPPSLKKEGNKIESVHYVESKPKDNDILGVNRYKGVGGNRYNGLGSDFKNSYPSNIVKRMPVCSKDLKPQSGSHPVYSSHSPVYSSHSPTSQRFPDPVKTSDVSSPSLSYEADNRSSSLSYEADNRSSGQISSSPRSPTTTPTDVQTIGKMILTFILYVGYSKYLLSKR